MKSVNQGQWMLHLNELSSQQVEESAFLLE